MFTVGNRIFQPFDLRQRRVLPLIDLSHLSFSSSDMPKQGGHSTRIHATKVKKHRGVGSRTITVLDSDEEDPLTITGDEYA
jgi:hypothetical protein